MLGKRRPRRSSAFAVGNGRKNIVIAHGRFPVTGQRLDKTVPALFIAHVAAKGVKIAPFQTAVDHNGIGAAPQRVVLIL